MIEFLIKYFKDSWFVIFQLFVILLFASVMKETNLMSYTLSWMYKKIKSKPLLIMIVSNILGALPIPGRITVASGVLDSIQDKDKNNQDLGVLAYLSTHHYYLWSPLEKAIIITIGAAGISYLKFVTIMLPIVIAYFVFLVFYVWLFMDKSQININEDYFKVEESYIKAKELRVFLVSLVILVTIGFVFGIKLFFVGLFVYLVIYYKNHLLESLKKLDWSLLLIIAGLLLITTYIKSNYTNLFKEYAKSHNSLVMYLIVTFIMSIVLGSSSRYAALAAIGVTVFGIKYLPLIYITEFSGYFVSPFHKCTIIAKTYFRVPWYKFFGIAGVFTLLLWTISLIITVFK